MVNIIKLDNGRYAKPCPCCNVMQDYLRKGYAEVSLRKGKLCKSCSNKITDNCHRGWHRGIRISWFNKFMNGAAMRKLEWSITLDDVANQMEKQQSKCALTDWDIRFPDVGMKSADASIDRIDSKVGYIPGNIQLVTKHVNMMKQSYSNLYFIEVCKAIAKNR